MRLWMLRPLYMHRGQWASVYLDVSRDAEDAAQAIPLRWRAARTELADLGAPEATLAALDGGVSQHQPVTGTGGLALFAASGRLAMAMPLPNPPVNLISRFGALPHVIPMLAQLGEQVPWLQVVVDRTGADLTGATAGGTPRRLAVTGSHTFPIRKVQPGGWSQPRYQRAAEVTWERNAEEIADVVADMAAQTGAEVIIVAGDPHARPLLVDHLPVQWQQRVVLTDGGSRAPGADPHAVDATTAMAVAEHAQRRVRDALDRFGSQLGRDAAAGTGLAATVDALRRAQVDTAFMRADQAMDAHLWIGPQPTDLAMSADDLRAAGVSDPVSVPAPDAIVRALAATDAELVFVHPEDIGSPADRGATRLEQGIGALLRYADAMPPGR